MEIVINGFPIKIHNAMKPISSGGFRLAITFMLDLEELKNIESNLELIDEIAKNIFNLKNKDCYFDRQSEKSKILLKFFYEFDNIIISKICKDAVKLFASNSIKSKAYASNPVKVVVLKAINE